MSVWLSFLKDSWNCFNKPKWIWRFFSQVSLKNLLLFIPFFLKCSELENRLIWRQILYKMKYKEFMLVLPSSSFSFCTSIVCKIHSPDLIFIQFLTKLIKNAVENMHCLDVCESVVISMCEAEITYIMKISWTLFWHRIKDIINFFHTETVHRPKDIGLYL